jgi:hypothetical protein
MRMSLVAIVAALAPALAIGQGQAPPDALSWAYNIVTPPPGGAPAAPPPAQPAADTASPRKLEGSDQSFTLMQIRDAFGPADWFPRETERAGV